MSIGEQVETKGKKYDAGKLPWQLVPWVAMREVVAVLKLGADKYNVGNWKFVPDARDRYFAATMRHLLAWYEGETRDPESGRHHLAHAVCCLLFLLWFSLAGKEGQDARTPARNRRRE